MKTIFAITKALSTYFYWISGVALACILFLTVADVILRMFNRPITGVYDITGVCAGVVIGLALPFTTWKKAHVYIDFLIDGGSPALKKILTTITTLCGIFLFMVLGWEFILSGIEVYKAGEFTGTIYIPIYPFTLAMGVSFLINTLVLLGHLVAVFGKGEKTWMP